MNKAYNFDVTLKVTFWVEPWEEDSTEELPNPEAVIEAYLNYCGYTLLNGKELSEAGSTTARVMAEIVETDDPEDVEEQVQEPAISLDTSAPQS